MQLYLSILCAYSLHYQCLSSPNYYPRYLLKMFGFNYLNFSLEISNLQTNMNITLTKGSLDAPITKEMQVLGLLYLKLYLFIN